MIEADSPNLWTLRKHMGDVKVKAVLVYALVWLSELVSVERNLTQVQVAELANDILNDHGYLKVEEVKYIFKSAVRSEKIFGRLDYNVVMGWIERYAAQRAEECRRLSEADDTRRYQGAYTPPTDAISYEEYIAQTRARAGAGDKDAERLLAEAVIPSELVKTVPAVSDREREQAFQEFRRQYVMEKKIKEAKNR